MLGFDDLGGDAIGSVSGSTNQSGAAEAGLFSLIGQDALGRYFVLPAVAGVFTLSGHTVIERHLYPDAGTFALSGQDAGLFREKAVQGAVGVFALNGQQVQLTPSQKHLTASGATFAVAGQSARLFHPATPLGAEAGSYTLEGMDVTFTITAIPPNAIYPPARPISRGVFGFSAVSRGGSRLRAMTVGGD